MVGKGGLEPPRLSAHDPKSCPSTSSGTPPDTNRFNILSYCLILCLTAHGVLLAAQISHIISVFPLFLCVIALKVGFKVESEATERCPSGLWCRSRKAVSVFSGAWVRIPPSPPERELMQEKR